LSLTPGDVVRGVVVRLSEPSRVEKPKQRCLGRHIVERCGARAGLKPFPYLSARVARESGDDRRLASPGLSKQPHHRRDRLCTLAGVLRAGARGAHVAEQNLADRIPEPIEKSHDCASSGGELEHSKLRTQIARIWKNQGEPELGCSIFFAGIQAAFLSMRSIAGPSLLPDLIRGSGNDNCVLGRHERSTLESDSNLVARQPSMRRPNDPTVLLCAGIWRRFFGFSDRTV
jgi:hypothetical protein